VNTFDLKANNPRLCTDCVHCEDRISPNMIFHYCGLAIDVVTGSLASCHTAREHGHLCGPLGKLWERAELKPSTEAEA
jgi:hypothetical protein